MQIHQVLASASIGDAVTNSAFQIRALLREVSHSEIYAYNRGHEVLEEVRPLAEFARRANPSSEDVMILHVSIGEPELTNFISHRSERLVIVYHNISPAEPFLLYAPQFSGLLAAGRAELPILIRRCELALADSEFNAQELRDLGFRNVAVSPLILNTPELLAMEPHEGTANHLRTLGDEPIALFVGQLLPHKRPDFLLHAYNWLCSVVSPEARLIMVGPARIDRYRRSIGALVQELSLPKAWIAGAVSDAELVAFYRRADVFVTASEHEGFCVPLIEAMAFDVPVVARKCAAIPDTVGDAGLLIERDDNPIVLGEAIGAILGDESVRASLVSRGRERVKVYEPDAARTAFLENMAVVL